MLQAEQILRDRYQLKQQLGQNSGRQTWLAEDLQTPDKQQVIIKLLAFTPQMQWEELKLFEREAQVLQHLAHPCIPNYRDYFSLDVETDSELPWFGLVQEYIPGSSLKKLLDKGKNFKELEVIKIAKQILKILIYLHELSPPVIHRDIKPSNLILGKDGQIYLVDFGAVQDKAKAEGVTFTVVGTSGYAPPEQLWGKAIPSSDLYALGATLIHLLTGIPPADLPQHQMRIEFRDKINLYSYLVNWLEKLTQPAAERRFSSSRQALEDLQKNINLRTYFQLPSSSVNYGRLAFLSLCGPLLGAVALMVMMVGKIDSQKRYDNDWEEIKTNQSEAIQKVSDISKYQADFYIEKGYFGRGDTQQESNNLNIKLANETFYYEYSVNITENASYSYATSKHNKLKSYVAAVFIVAKSKDYTEFSQIACESNQPGLIFPAKPIYKKGKIACGDGTREISRK